MQRVEFFLPAIKRGPRGEDATAFLSAYAQIARSVSNAYKRSANALKGVPERDSDHLKEIFKHGEHALKLVSRTRLFGAIVLAKTKRFV